MLSDLPENTGNFNSRVGLIRGMGGSETSATSVRAVYPTALDITMENTPTQSSLSTNIFTSEFGDIISGSNPSDFVTRTSRSMKPFDLGGGDSGFKILEDNLGSQTPVQLVKSASKTLATTSPSPATLASIGQNLVTSSISPQIEATPVLFASGTIAQPSQITRTIQRQPSPQAQIPLVTTLQVPRFSQPTPTQTQVQPPIFGNPSTTRISSPTAQPASPTHQRNQVQISIPAQPQLQPQVPQLRTRQANTTTSPPPSGGFGGLSTPSDKNTAKMLGLARKAMSSEAFKVQVSRGGKFKTIAEGLPKGRALKLGADITASTLASQFRIVRTGETQLGDIGFKPNPKVFRTYKIVKGRNVPLPQGADIYQFIEKQTQRLKSRGELSQIEVFKQRGIQRAKQSRFFGGRRRKLL